MWQRYILLYTVGYFGPINVRVAYKNPKTIGVPVKKKVWRKIFKISFWISFGYSTFIFLERENEKYR